jgi:hypothetical protein
MGKKTTSRVVSDPVSKSHFDITSLKTISVICCVILLIFGVGIIVGRKSNGFSGADSLAAKDAIKVKPGPWGNMVYVPITLAAPQELLKVRSIESTPIKWLLEGVSPAGLARMLDSSGVPDKLKNALLSPQCLSTASQGLVMTPPQEAIANLTPPSALESIYRLLSKAKYNEQYKWTIPLSNVEKMKNADVSAASVALLKKMSCREGKFLICYCMPYVLAGIPSYEEKVALIKALSSQETMLVRLKISPETDVDALVAYWGKSYWAHNVRALLESLKKLPNGGTTDIIELLPSLATSLLYTYPAPQSGLTGPAVCQNCSWTALNFFNEKPDEKCSDANYVAEKLKTDYYQVQSDPHFGDVIVFLTPDKFMIHLAVYIAEDIVFTKNGDNPNHPWIFSHISDLQESFSYVVQPGENLSLLYFRNKNF